MSVVPRLLMLACCAGSACASPGAAADELSGSVTVGWRDVAVSGSQAKYDEDINLPSGPRLVGAQLEFRAQDDDEGWPDLVSFDVANIGGEPYENLRLEVREYGAYHFRAERRRSAYFYDDILVLPEDASISGSTGGDFHRYDFERTRDKLSLDVDLTEQTRLMLGLERFDKRGSSTTTLDIQRDEFEFDKPIDESMQVWRVGLRHDWDAVSLTLEERVSDYRNETELFLPGFSEGGNTADPTTLDFFFLNQPYDYKSYEHTARIRLTPSSRLQLAVAAVVGNLDLDVDSSERSQGTDFLGAPFVTDVSGNGAIERDTALIDGDVTFTVNDRLQLLAGIRHQRLDQSGGLAVGAAEGGQSSWDIESTGYQLGVLYAASPAVTVSAGWSGERRDVESAATPLGDATRLTARQTDSDGFFGSLDYRAGEALTLTASIDNSSFDDPFSLASPTSSTRYRLRGKYRINNDLSVSGSHSRIERDNDTSDWADDTVQTDLRLNYASDRLTWSVGATVVDLSRDFQRLVIGGTRQDLFDVAYAADTSYVDAAVSWKMRDDLALGANYRAYDNDGSFNVKRDDALGFVDIGLPRNFLLRLSYRYLNYGEGGIEYYDADIVEAALRLNF